MNLVPMKTTEQPKGVTVTLGHLVRAEQTLVSLCMQTVPPRFAYHLSRLLSLVQQKTKTYKERRFALIKELGVERLAKPGEGADPTVFEVTPDNLPAFRERSKELESEEATIDRWLLKLDQLSVLQVTGNDLQALGPLVVVAEEDAK